jgi:hypothetical protein
MRFNVAAMSSSDQRVAMVPMTATASSVGLRPLKKLVKTIFM